jgi:peptidoglycan/LPS O-acetylase OafA/YrhL
MAERLHYRPEVDGLRAIAVIAVLLFHFNPRFAPGGFTGVDIFFVISGFLITSIIVKSQAKDGFSFREFYASRVRRIAPAYLTVVFATLIAGCLLMQSADLVHLGKSALWSLLAAPNVFFWLHLDTGYFAADSRQLPLLHLWSLGVEEQFYVLWPILLLVGLKVMGKRLLFGLMALLIVGSFAYAHRQSVVDPAFAYYMLPTRAGELAIGALLAMIPAIRNRGRDGGIRYEAGAAAGLCLMAWSIFALDGTTRFPGWNALPACLGAALVIASDSRRRCVVLAPLRWRPVVAVGLISYSLYLWHWPILAFARYLGLQFDAQTIAALLVLILGTALSSYWFVERRARSLRLSDLRITTVLFFLPVSILLVMAAVVITQAERISALVGEPGVGATERKLLAGTAPAYEFPYNCQLEQFDSAVLDRPQCRQGASAKGREDILLWGDSHAAHHIGILATIAGRNGLSMRNASLSTCPPVWSDRTDYGMSTYRAACTRFRALIRDRIAPYPVVAIGAQWSVHASNGRFWNDFEHTLDALLADGKSVVLLAEVPSFPSYDRHCDIRNLRHAFVDCPASMTRPDTGPGQANAHLYALAASRDGVEVLDIHDLVCRDGTCSPYIDGAQVYFDPSHLSMAGSWMLGERLLESRGVRIPAALSGGRSRNASPE